MANKSKLSFYGGIGTVTGANFLLETDKIKILVDCGLYQGTREIVEKNKEPFRYKPGSIDYLFVTHSHMDHIGRIPRLVKLGFHGKIYSTPSTRAIAELMFEDALKIQDIKMREEGITPLYQKEDVEKALGLWKTIKYDEDVQAGDFKVLAKDAGHILGSAMYEFSRNGKKLVFTGDLGNRATPLLRQTDKITDANYLVMESVYGDTNHEAPEQKRNLLARAINDSIRKGGTLLIPAFSLERTQVLLYEIHSLLEEAKIKREVPVFVDSPLAIKITEIYKEQKENFNDEVQGDLDKGHSIFDFSGQKLTKTSRESKEIDEVKGPKIIIAGSGMSVGGRILEHEKKYLSDSKNTFLLVGFQGLGTLGRKIREGAKKVRIGKKEVRIRAEVRMIKGYSSHKDSDHLIEFVEQTRDSLKKVFVTMGEPKSGLFLTQRLRDYLDIDATYPGEGESFEINL